jgi:hypothetical protein
MLAFALVEALMGRRARRFFMGAEIPDGVFAYKSRHQPVPDAKGFRAYLTRELGHPLFRTFDDDKLEVRIKFGASFGARPEMSVDGAAGKSDASSRQSVPYQQMR